MQDCADLQYDWLRCSKLKLLTVSDLVIYEIKLNFILKISHWSHFMFDVSPTYHLTVSGLMRIIFCIEIYIS